MQDTELRERFADWARPIQDTAPPALTVIRSRARRRVAVRVSTGAGTLAVAGVVAGLVITALPGAGAGRPGPAAPGPVATGGVTTAPDRGTPDAGRFPAGAPFLVTIGPGGATTKAVIHDMATGAVTGRVAAPVSGDTFTWASAASSDREFVLAAQDTVHLSTRFYVLRLDSAGHPAGLRLLGHAGSVTGEIIGMGLSPDGSQFYVDTVTQVGVAGEALLWVIPTDGSDQIRQWQTTTGTLGAISWEPDGSLAVAIEPGQTNDFTMYTVTPSELAPTKIGVLPEQAHLAPAGLSPAGRPQAQITPDGSAVLVVAQSGTSLVLDRYDTATGQLAESVPMGPLSAQGGSNYCGVLWTSPSGSSVLVQCGNGQEWVSAGKATSVRLALSVPTPAVGWANTFAW